MDIISILRDHGVNIGTVKKNGGGGLGNSYVVAHTLPTTELSQKTWNVPEGAYDSETDTILLYHNTGILDKESWTLSGSAATGYQVNIPDNPETAIEDNNVIIVVLRNAPTVPNGVDISGTRLTNTSVGLAKLGQDVLDAIAAAGSKIEIVNDLTTGGADKAASAETAKTLNENQEQHDGKIATGTTLGHVKGSDTLTIDPDGTAHAKQVEIVNNTTDGGTTKAASAETVKALKIDVDKKVEINKFHSNRTRTNLSPQSFTKAMYVDFTNSTTSEVAEILIPPAVAFSGSIELNLTSSFYNSDATGTAKIMIHITMSSTGNISTQIVDIITMTPKFAQNFYVREVLWIAASNTYVLPIYKRQFSNPLQIEMTCRCSGRNFSQTDMDALRVSTYSVGSIISTTEYPIQQSIFTHVGNSKVLLAASITGKGKQTSPNDTFAQMAANIDAIPAGLKYYEITLSGNVAQKKFYSVGGSLINSDFNFITVTIPFNPALVHVRSIRTGDYFVESYYTSFSDGFTTGTVKMAQYNGLQVNGSNFNMRPFTTNLGNGSWSYEIPVLNYNTTYTIRAYG